MSSISAPPAQPVLFKTQLQNLERQAGDSASLRCKTTKPGASVVWRCGDRVLASSSKYHLKQEGTVVELVIYKLHAEDTGEYSCDTGSQRTSAVLTVQGRSCSISDCPFHAASGVTSFLHVLRHSNTWAWHASVFHLDILFAAFLTTFKCSHYFSPPHVFVLQVIFFKTLVVIHTITFLLRFITCLSLVSFHKPVTNKHTHTVFFTWYSQ